MGQTPPHQETPPHRVALASRSQRWHASSDCVYILGFNCFMDDASACLLRDGEIVVAVQEERLSRRKHDGAFPALAIERCLQAAGVAVGDLDHVAFNFAPLHDFHRRVGSVLQGMPKSLRFAASHGPDWLSMFRVARTFRERVGRGRYRFHFVQHHMAHAASTFFLSPFSDAAVLAIDGSGESASTVYARGSDNRIEALRSIHFPQSLGYFYMAFTQYLGFKKNSGEGKVMGLASYGDPSRFRGVFREIARATAGGGYALDLSYFQHHRGAPIFYSPKVPATFGHPPRVPESEILQFHEDLAAALQERLEELCFHVLRDLQRRTGLTQLCLAGGVALNCSMNGLVRAHTPFSELFVPSPASDCGGGLGAALWVHHQVLGNARRGPLQHAFFGPEYSEAEVTAALAGDFYVEKVDAVERGAELLAAGKCIGWFQGRSELGPRALGSRSILADPRVLTMADHLNARVKYREAFRPFAPAVLEERAHDFFLDYVASPFMLQNFKVRPERAAEIPAVVHVDGTSRVQGVTREACGLFYDLIKRFAARTGVPVLLNTSLNLRGEPLVETPADALRTFAESGLDDLIIGNLHVCKAAAARLSAPGAEHGREVLEQMSARESASPFRAPSPCNCGRRGVLRGPDGEAIGYGEACPCSRGARKIGDRGVGVAPAGSDRPGDRHVRRRGMPIMILADLLGDYLPLPRATQFGTMPALSFAVIHQRRAKLLVKRAIDLVVASALLALTGPIVACAAALIKITSPGPVFFRQIRSGLDGRPFTMLKLRTMHPDAEERLREVAHLNELSGPVFKIRCDPRVTRVGRLLRRWSLDELPQLWNVVRGDMSLVGPRPPIPAEVDRYRKFERRRLSMRPGLTCLWQVSGRNEIGFEEWVRLDLEYIDRWSLRQDFRILARTLPAVVRGTGAS